MTLDLGFSAFFAPIPGHWKGERIGAACPVSTRRLRTVLDRADSPRQAAVHTRRLSGPRVAHSHDSRRRSDHQHDALGRRCDQRHSGRSFVLLRPVVRRTDKRSRAKQTQTAECLVIGEITAKQMVLVLNKIDLLPAPFVDSLETVCACSFSSSSLPLNAKARQMRKRLAMTMKKTRFPDAPIIGVAANNADFEASISCGSDQASERCIASLTLLFVSQRSRVSAQHRRSVSGRHAALVRRAARVRALSSSLDTCAVLNPSSEKNL